MSLGVGEQNDIRQRNYEMSMGTVENDHLAVLFGNPFTGTKGGADRHLWRTHKDYPDALQNAQDNTYWSDLVLGLGLVDPGPFGSIICPLTYVTQIEFRWRERKYQVSILDYNPEETAARMLRQTEQTFEARLSRRGLMAQMEVGYARTPAGVQDWIYQTQAFADSIKMTIVADVVWSVMNAPRSARDWELQHGFTKYDVVGRLMQDAVWYGAANLTANAFDMWDEEMKRHAKQNLGFTPDVYIAEPKGLAVARKGQMAFFRENKFFMFKGPDGVSATMAGEANVWSINNTPMYVTPTFSSYENTEHIPTTIKTCVVSTYHLLLDTFAESGDQRHRTLDQRTIFVHDEDSDTDVPIQLVTAIKNDNFWDSQGEVDGEIVDKWRDDPAQKSCHGTFKYGASSQRQYSEKVRFFGQMEEWALKGRTIFNVATSALSDLSEQDLTNINTLFETFKDIREQPTARFIRTGVNQTTAQDFKKALAEATAEEIRTNAALASFPALEALADKDPEVKKCMVSFKLMVKKLKSIYGGFSHVVDGAYCPVFWRDVTRDREACTVWHFIVDEGTAPTFFTNGAQGAGRAQASVFADLKEIREALDKVSMQSVLPASSKSAEELFTAILAALRRVAAQTLADAEDKRRTQFTEGEQAAVRAPIAFVRLTSALKDNLQGLQSASQAMLQPGAEDVDKFLAELTAPQAIRMLERGVVVLNEIDADAANRLLAEGTTLFSTENRNLIARGDRGGGVGGSLFPSPYVATAGTIGQEMFRVALRPADKDTGFSSPLSAPAPAGAGSEWFYSVYNKARPSAYSKDYPAANFSEGAYEERNPYARNQDLGLGDYGSMLMGVGADPQQGMFASVDRVPVQAGVDIVHGQWFLNEVNWTNSPSFVNNWNRILGTTDIPLKVSMAAFLFCRYHRDALLKMCEKGNMAIPYQGMAVKNAHSHDMGGYVLTKSGPELGITAWTNPLSMTQDSTTLMMSEKHFALYEKCIIKNPHMVIRWPAAYFCGYKGGGGTKPYTMPDVEAWIGNHFLPPVFARFMPSLLFIQLSPSETDFRPIVDYTGRYPTANGSISTEKALHYSSALFYQDKYQFQRMNANKPGFHAYYPAAIAPRVAYRGRWLYAHPSFPGKLMENPNQGHLKDEYPGIGKLRQGYLASQPLRQGEVRVA